MQDHAVQAGQVTPGCLEVEGEAAQSSVEQVETNEGLRASQALIAGGGATLEHDDAPAGAAALLLTAAPYRDSADQGRGDNTGVRAMTALTGLALSCAGWAAGAEVFARAELPEGARVCDAAEDGSLVGLAEGRA
ncbi:hypothetical protein [Streptomyces acidicola]|uniref:hypothetical protein n=1 Tax=Streptomyces acidicola TaxID=2596892 RepID=UPI00381234C4